MTKQKYPATQLAIVIRKDELYWLCKLLGVKIPIGRKDRIKLFKDIKFRWGYCELDG